MAQYIVSARKYRPDSFESLIGQDNIARTLKNSILRGQLAHAYLFCGPRGVGKTSAARIFAKTINCANPGPDMEPCGECESCISFKEGRSYCIHELDAASNNGVDDIKALMEQVQIPPQVGKYSVYIIDEVHMLSQSAFNAFLKTLEEPPAHAIFILATTEKHKIIPTILSRCQTYDFNRISVPDIVRNLRDIAGKEGVRVDDESLHVIAHKADGAMRDALTIFDQTVAFCGTDIKYEDVIRNLNVLDYEYSFKLVDAFLAGDYATAMLVFDEILAKGFNALHFISAVGSHLRDLLVSRTGGLESLLDLPASLRERYREQAGRCTVKFLYDALGIVSQCEAGYRAATNQRLHIEFALMRMAFIGGVPAATQQTTIPLHPQGTGEASPATPSVAPSELRTSGPSAVSSDSKTAQTVSSAPITVEPKAADAGGTDAGVVSGNSGRPWPLERGGPAAEQWGGRSEVEVSGGNSCAVEPVSAEKPYGKEMPDQVGHDVKGIGHNVKEVKQDLKETGKEVRPRKRASGLSLSALMSEEEITVELATEGKVEEKALPEPEDVMAKWPELVAQYDSQPRLANALGTAKLSAVQEDGLVKLTFALVNEAQKNWIAEKRLRDLETRFCKLMDSTAIRLVPDVIPHDQQEKKIYMPVEKAQDLMSRNPEVTELVKDLALDIR